MAIIALVFLIPSPLFSGEAEERTRDPNPYYKCLDLAKCLDEFRDREFFEFMYRQAYIERTASHKFTLGILYQFGLGVPADSARAARWYREAEAAGYEFPLLGKEAVKHLAELGSPVLEEGAASSAPAGQTYMEMAVLASDDTARLRLATQYFYGLCAPMDYEKSRDWEIQAAEAGDREAMKMVVLSSSSGEYAYPRDPALAEKWRTALNAGKPSPEPDATHPLTDEGMKETLQRPPRSLTEYAAEIYREGKRQYEGDGIAVDYFLAGLRFLEAAGFGIEEPENYFLLGWIQENGLCGEANPYGAGKYYRIAAELGHSLAMFRLGMLHEEGRGVRISRAEAEKWYAGAAAAGVNGAEERMRLLRQGNTPGRKEAWETSPAFRAMRADAQFRASFNHSIFRLPAEMRKATAMLLRAAEAGHPAAQFLAGKMYLKGDEKAGIFPNHEKGLALLQQAARAGVPEAVEELRGIAEENGE